MRGLYRRPTIANSAAGEACGLWQLPERPSRTLVHSSDQISHVEIGGVTIELKPESDRLVVTLKFLSSGLLGSTVGRSDLVHSRKTRDAYYRAN